MKHIVSQSGELTTGSIYRAFDRLVRRIERWSGLDRLQATGCEPGAVKARTIQRIVELANEDFTRHVTTTSVADAELVLGGLRISPGSGRVEVSFRLWMKSLLVFGLAWGRFAMHLCRAFRSRPPQVRASATVLIGASGIDESPERFARFCRAGPVTPLAHANRIVVATQRAIESTDPRIEFTPHPLPAVAAALPWPDRWKLLAAHLTAPVRFAYTLLLSPPSILVSRDLALVPAMGWLDRHGVLDALIVTTSDFSSQPLWMHGLRQQRFPLHMIWYSQNFMPKMYVGEEQRSDLPAARHMRVDEHWVWTDGFADYLRQLDQRGRIHVIGPLLWYLDEGTRACETDGALRVAVFDVTPFGAGRTAFGAAKNYYSVDTIRQFVTDIVRVCDEISAATGCTVTVLLKHKRGASTAQHDRTYIDFLDRLQEERPGFRLIDHRTDLYTLLGGSDLSISVPYTSTAYVAAHLGKPAIYYDPFAELVPLHEPRDHVMFCAGPAELQQTVGRILVDQAAVVSQPRQGT